MLRYSVVLNYDPEDNVWLASVPAMDDAVTDGTTYDEALERARDLIRSRLVALRDRGQPAPIEEHPARIVVIEVS